MSPDLDLMMMTVTVKKKNICSICSFNSPDLDGHRAPKMKYCPRRDPQKVSKPKYEATALCSHQSIGYPNQNETKHRTSLLVFCIRIHKADFDILGKGRGGDQKSNQNHT